MQGLGAPTAQIAQEAGIATGSLFTYFETKSVLLNDLYLELKGEMAAAVLAGLPADADIKAQMEHMWAGWIGWAIEHQHKRSAPIGLVAGLLSAVAEATVDFVASHPAHSAKHRASGFAAAWRMLT